MTRTVFLVNPASANGRTGKRWPQVAHRAAVAGLAGDALFSERAGHLGELARDAALGGAELLVVVGGDGTVNEVVNGLAALSDPPELAILPHGTGWDFVRTFGIPRGPTPPHRWRSSGAARTIDLGRVTYRAWDGQRRKAIFANVASAGMSGAIAQRANGTTKALGGKASYLLATFAVFTGWSAVEMRVTVDGEAPRAAACSTSSSRTAASSAAG